MAPMARISRRASLRMLGLASVGGLAAACQILPTARPTTVAEAPTPAPTSTATAMPTVAPTGVASAVPGLSVGVSGARVAIDLDADTLDPAGQTNPTIASIVDHMAETLVRANTDGSLGPGLARSWTVSADAKTFIFDLRPDVVFHDGSPLTAEAAAGSLRRFLGAQLRVPLRAPFDASLVDTVSAVDPKTLRVTLKQTSRVFLAKLSATELAIVSPAHARAYPDTFNDEPIGTGPYRFKERRRGESVVLERFDRYWGRPPALPTLQFRIVPEAATRQSLLLANQVEVMVQPTLADLPALAKNAQVSVLTTPTARTAFVALDLTLPGGTPLAIKKVRQALNFAIDRDAIIRNVLFGTATPLDAPLAPGVSGYARVGSYAYDPNRARSLLSEGGTPRLQLRFLHLTGRSVSDALAAQIAQAVAGYLHDAGADTDLIGADWASFLAAVNVPEDRGTAHMHLFNWTPALLDASQAMTQFVRGQWPPQGLATSHYWNPKVELLVSQAERERDDARRQELYAEAERIVWDDAPWIFLWSPSMTLVHTSRVKGLTALPTEKFSAAYLEPA